MYAPRISPPPTRSTFAPHIAAPRHGSRSDSGSGSRLPLFFRRMIKFPQMDFEMAIWEMTYLIMAPKKVIRTIYYHRRKIPGLVMTPFVSIMRLIFSLVFLHFLLTSVIFASAGYIMCGKFLKVPGTGGLGRAGVVAGEGEMEFMYCLEIGVRAFFPVWVFLYVIQFLMMPILTKDYWISIFLGNSLYLIAFSFYCVITFLGYNALPFLHHTEIMLFPIFILVVLWAISLFGFNLTKHIVPILLPVTGRI
ncbi:UNC-50 family-domain-containing protein [Tuber brumale]|nr:UNC-50 family-domain-containing protein [Tuber brumale]